ncbi:MAG TPA: aminopeptidase P family N-terminal domain-containing protein, partial [Stellaceae bacterium]
MDKHDDGAGCRGTYQGDEVLARLLAKAGSRYDLAGLRALVEGVLAAPPSVADPDGWTALAAPEVSPALKAQLVAFAAELAAAASAGSAAEPSPAERLAALRAALARRGVQGFLVPRADEHQNEYVPACAQRLAWLTGFTGSAGLAAVLPERAAVFVDGRYTLQVGAEVDTSLYDIRHITNQPPGEWVAANLRPGEILGYDPWLHTAGEIERLRAAAERAGGKLQPLDSNPLDEAWAGRPPAPLAPVFPHDQRFAGKPAADKRREVAASLRRDRVDAAVLTTPDSIAWLLNIRGGDVPRTPLPLSVAIVSGDEDGAVDLFIDDRKLVPGLAAHLGNGVAVRPPAALGEALDRLGAGKKKVQADPGSAAAWVLDRLTAAEATLHRAADPCLVPKACKSEAELAGTRAAHRRDGAAL